MAKKLHILILIALATVFTIKELYKLKTSSATITCVYEMEESEKGETKGETDTDAEDEELIFQSACFNNSNVLAQCLNTPVFSYNNLEWLSPYCEIALPPPELA